MKANFTYRSAFSCHSLLLNIQGMDEDQVY